MRILILVFALSGCATTKVQLFCDGTQSWSYTDCKDTKCTEYVTKQCLTSQYEAH